MISTALPWILDSVLLCVIVQAAATLRQFLGLRTLERLADSHPDSASLIPDIINAARPKGAFYRRRHRRKSATSKTS
jgi:hypothetical protein